MDDGQLSQDDIDSLLSGESSDENLSGREGGGDSAEAPQVVNNNEGLTDQAGVDDLLAQLNSDGGDAQAKAPSGEKETGTAVADMPPGKSFALPEADSSQMKNVPAARSQIELLKDVSVKVRIELGRGKMYLKDILRLTHGSVVELEKLAGDPLDIYVNERLIAKGEVLVLNENFCVRITEIFSPEEMLRLQG